VIPSGGRTPTPPSLRESNKAMSGDSLSWPLFNQIRDRDPHGFASASPRTQSLRARIASADRAVESVCPYCAVGCGQLVYVKDEKIVDIEGDPASPVSQGCLCPKGAATFQLVTGEHREHRVLYRRPRAAHWESISLDQATQMVAERVKRDRDHHWQGAPLNRTMAIAHLGGATLDNEENYLIKKLFTALGIVQVENQARI